MIAQCIWWHGANCCRRLPDAGPLRPIVSELCWIRGSEGHWWEIHVPFELQQWGGTNLHCLYFPFLCFLCILIVLNVLHVHILITNCAKTVVDLCNAWLLSCLYDCMVQHTQGRHFWIKLSLPEDGDIKGAQLEPDWQLNLLLKGYQHALQQVLGSGVRPYSSHMPSPSCVLFPLQKLSESTTLVDFLGQFKIFLVSSKNDVTHTHTHTHTPTHTHTHTLPWLQGHLLQTRDIPEMDNTPRSFFYECVLAELEEIGFEKYVESLGCLQLTRVH